MYKKNLPSVSDAGLRVLGLVWSWSLVFVGVADALSLGNPWGQEIRI